MPPTHLKRPGTQLRQDLQPELPEHQVCPAPTPCSHMQLSCRLSTGGSVRAPAVAALPGDRRGSPLTRAHPARRSVGRRVLLRALLEQPLDQATWAQVCTSHTQAPTPPHSAPHTHTLSPLHPHTQPHTPPHSAPHTPTLSLPHPNTLSPPHTHAHLGVSSLGKIANPTHVAP